MPTSKVRHSWRTGRSDMHDDMLQMTFGCGIPASPIPQMQPLLTWHVADTPVPRWCFDNGFHEATAHKSVAALRDPEFPRSWMKSFVLRAGSLPSSRVLEIPRSSASGRSRRLRRPVSAAGGG
jgi:hypothetical protein